MKIAPPRNEELVALLLGSFILARVAGHFIVCFKLISKRELSTGLDFKSNVLNPLLQNTFSLI